MKLRTAVAAVATAAGLATVAGAAPAQAAASTTLRDGNYPVASAATNAPTGRYTATGSWRAGGRIIDGRASEWCSAGFSGRAANGARYLLTGYHCINPHDTRIFGPSTYVGRATSTAASLDSAAIRTNTTSPTVYTGAYNSRTIRAVTKVATPYVGMRVCTSGSFSGMRCYATVKGQITAQLTTAWGVRYTAHLWYATSDSNSEIIRSGDSGGPVFVGTGAHTVTAVGIIAAGYNGGVRCAGTPGGSTSNCYRTVLFSSVSADAARLHLNLTR